MTSVRVICLQDTSLAVMVAPSVRRVVSSYSFVWRVFYELSSDDDVDKKINELDVEHGGNTQRENVS